MNPYTRTCILITIDAQAWHAVKEPSAVLQDVVDEPLTADLVEEPSAVV